MFRRQVKPLGLVLNQFLRNEGLEGPLQQKRLVDAWDTVAGRIVARYTAEKFISNQTLHVRVLNPALKQDLAMMRTELVKRLNAAVGANVITDLHIY